jgi:hypothetical protein
MIKYPLIYLYLYCKIRKRIGGKETVICSKSAFRKMIAEPIGIDRRAAEFMLRDIKRYHMIRSITHGRKGMIEFKNPADDADLFSDLVELRRANLI